MKGKAKVFLGFVLAPLLVGLVCAVLFNVLSFASFVEDPRRMGQMRPGEGFVALLVYPLAAEVVLLVPCLLAALASVLLRLRRNWRGCAAAGVTGGTMALLWCTGILYLMSKAKPYDMMPTFGGGFALFAVTCLACAAVCAVALPVPAGRAGGAGAAGGETDQPGA